MAAADGVTVTWLTLHLCVQRLIHIYTVEYNAFCNVGVYSARSRGNLAQVMDLIIGILKLLTNTIRYSKHSLVLESKHE